MSIHDAPPEVLQPHDIRDEETIRQFGELIVTLTKQEHDPLTIAAHLREVTESPTTDTLYIPDKSGKTVSMATINYCDTLNNSPLSWIDDVATLETHQGRGLSGRIMEALEKRAARFGSVVQLTSNPNREGARRGYFRRRYELIELHQGGVWRKELGAISDDVVQSEPRTRVTTLNQADVQAIGEVLPDLENLDSRLQDIVESPASALFVAQDRNSHIAAIALVHMCPIPIGHKPWISLPFTDKSETAARQVISDAEEWVSRVHSSVDYFVTPDRPNGMSNYQEDYIRRGTGLFVKNLLQR